MVRTPDFQSGNSDSNSGGVTNFYIMNIFKKLFKHITSEPKQISIKQEPVKYLNNLAQFDDVWIGINSEIFEGWVVERKENIVDIIYTNAQHKLIDVSFKIERPFNRESLEQGNKILYLTKRAAGI